MRLISSFSSHVKTLIEGLEKHDEVAAIGEITADDATQNDNNTDNDHHGRGTRSVTLRECG